MLTITLLVLGLLTGSFLNVVIHRLPIMMHRQWCRDCEEILETPPAGKEEPINLVRPGSRCPRCNAPIKAWQNIPVVSYLLLKGRCHDCGAPISARYPAVELITGLASAAVAWRFGATPEMLAALVLTWSLIALTGIDLDHQLLPDNITLPLLWAGLALSLMHDGQAAAPLFVDPATAIIGALAGYLSLWSVYWAFKLATGKEGMGYGDFKLLAALGAWLGWQMLPLVIILSALVGAATGIAMIVFLRHQASKPIPFGPYLAAAGWIALLWGEQIVDGYLRLSGMR